MFRERAAITQMQGIIAVAVIIVAIGAGAYFTLGGSSSGSGAIDLTIVETDPVLQLSSFNPTNITVTHDTNVTLVIQNRDDVGRTFVISAFNVSQYISSGAAARVTFSVGSPGVFTMQLPPTLPANGFRASPLLTGYVIVT